uniref:Calmodulin binding protein n=1 Tax=Solanum tuberosum TaxID=4113 RepID=M0ZR84_SOLTU
MAGFLVSVFVVVGSVFMGFGGSFGCCFVSDSSCWLQQCCFVVILAGDGGSDGFGVGYLVGLASSKLLRFMGCAPVWRKKENCWVGGTCLGSFGGGVLPEKEENEREFWIGKGSSKNEKAQKLAIKSWLEAIDPRHRYGVNLNRYHDVWCNSGSSQPFFYWLDIGDGKEVIVEQCSRSDLQSQCIKYLGPKEREAYEVIVKNGKLIYKKNGVCVDTIEGTKWIFVLSTSRTLYVGQKQRHHFHHSSFLAGGASLSSGRLVVSNGDLEAIWAYSGHYRPTEEQFEEIISFLQDHHVDLTSVKVNIFIN